MLDILGHGLLPEGNVISGNGRHGILVTGEYTHDIVIQGNTIGLNADQATGRGNAGDGIRIENARTTLIGGLEVGAGNSIAFNGANGVQVLDTRYSAVGNRILSNAIYGNGEQGIAIGYVRQPSPTVWYAYNRGGATTIQLSVPADSGSAVTLQLFANDGCTPGGKREGKQFLGTVSATANSTGRAIATFTAPSQLALGKGVTALATDAAGNTSEFSSCASVSPPFQIRLPSIPASASQP